MIRKFFLVTLFLTCMFGYAKADISPSIWDFYKTLSENTDIRLSEAFPGRYIGKTDNLTEFTTPWSHRTSTYELHFEDKNFLGRAVYSLARYCGDISEEISRIRVANGVEGFHYSSSQICDWINAIFKGSIEAPVAEEFYLASLLLRDGVVKLENGTFHPSSKIGHVLASAPGKKRSITENLRHERLHVLWDEEDSIQRIARSKWSSFSEAQKKEIRESLKGYANNEELLLEEWAVRAIQAGDLNIGE